MGSKRILNRQIADEASSPLTLFMPVYGGRIRLTHKDALLATKSGTSYKALELYMDLLSDSRIQTALTKQTGEITSRKVIIEPGNAPGEEPTDEDKSAAEFCEDVLMRLQEPAVDELFDFAVLPGEHSFDTLTRSLLVATITSIMPAEMVWRRDKRGRAVIDRAIAIDPRRFIYEQDIGTSQIYPKLVTRNDTIRGEHIPCRKFVFHRHWSVFGSDMLGMGYGSALYWLVQWKREALTFWLSVLDRYADPPLIGTKPKNAVKEDVEEFIANLQAFSRETNMVKTEGFEVDTLKSNPQQSVALLENLVNWCDSEITLMLTGEDVTGQKATGSAFGGRETVSNSIRIMKAKSWSDELNMTIRNTMLTWLTKLNYPKANVPKISRQFMGMSEVLEIAKAYKDLGLQVEPDYLEDATGVPIRKKREAKVPQIPEGLL